MERFGIFETVRVESGKPVLTDYHYSRLRRSSFILGIPLKLSKEEFERVLVEGAPHGTKLVRFTLYKSGNFEISVRDCKKREFVSLFPVYSVGRSYSVLSEHKTIDIMDSLTAINEAKRFGYDEALLFDEKGFVSETAFANIFFFKDGILFTPSLMCGCLRGTRREFIRDICKAMGLPIVEGFFKLKDVLNADEVFITSSREDTCLVNKIGSYRIKIPRGGPISERIKKVILRLHSLN
jgi:branched-chain amino acid aminotransferase